jgi:hypothetical protein
VCSASQAAISSPARSRAWAKAAIHTSGPSAPQRIGQRGKARLQRKARLIGDGPRHLVPGIQQRGDPVQRTGHFGGRRAITSSCGAV